MIAGVTLPTLTSPRWGVEVAVEHGTGLADRRRRPACPCDREPSLEQLADGRTNADSSGRLDGNDHRCELVFGNGSAAPDRDRTVDTPPGVRVNPDMDPQFPGTFASLTQ